MAHIIKRFAIPETITITTISNSGRITSRFIPRKLALAFLTIPVIAVLLSGSYLFNEYRLYKQSVQAAHYEQLELEEILAEVKSHILSTQLLAKGTARLGAHLSNQIPYEYDYSTPENSPRSSLISSMQTLSNPEYSSADVVYESAETILDVSETLAASTGNIQTVQTIVNRIKAIPDGLPVKGKLVSGFGIRKSPFGNVLQLHRGLDIVAKLNTPVTSGGDGIVVFAGTSYLWGKNIVIDHGFGIFTQYGHLNDIAVKLDDRVRKGEIIGKLGKTGRATGAHLHYQIWVNEIPLDPFMFLAAGEKRHLKIDSPNTTADGSAPQLPEGGSR